MNAALRPLIHAALGALLLLASACGDSASGPADTPRTLLAGLVLDGDGDAIGGVNIEIVSADGSSSTATADDGRYEREVDLRGAAIVRFSKPGFVPTIKRADLLDDVATTLNVHLIEEATALPLDADLGGTVTSADGVTLIAPAGVFVDAAGATVTGTVDVSLTFLDPSTPEGFDAYPGDMQAETAAGDLVMLETFGVADITVRQNGAKLQVKDGMTITVRIPVPDSVVTPPDMIPLWGFDEARALWIEESSATWNATDRVFEGELPHMSPWNLDVPLLEGEVTCISGRVVDADGAPIAGAHVIARGLSYLGGTAATSAADGSFCLIAKVNSEVEVVATTFGGAGGTVTTVVQTGTAPPACDTRPEDCTQTGDLVIAGGTIVPGDAACPLDIFGLSRDLTASGELTMTRNGQTQTLRLAAATVYPANVLASEPTPAACVGTSVDGDLDDWMSVTYSLLLEDPSGAPALVIQNVGGVLVTQAIENNVAIDSLFDLSGELRRDPAPAQCGAPLSLVFDQLARGQMPAIAGGEADYVLDGTLTLGLPDRGPSTDTGPFADLCGMDGGGTELRSLTSADLSLLPFDGDCLAAGSSVTGGGLITERFTATSDTTRLGASWIVALVIARSANQPETLTLADTPNGPAADAAMAAGTFSVAIEDDSDGLGGVDWRATAGTLQITDVRDDGFTGQLSVTLSRLGACDVAPAVTLETVELTAELFWADAFAD